jgi:hypothetical protein
MSDMANAQLQHTCGHPELHTVSDVPELLALSATPCSACQRGLPPNFTAAVLAAYPEVLEPQPEPEAPAVAEEPKPKGKAKPAKAGALCPPCASSSVPGCWPRCWPPAFPFRPRLTGSSAR